ncbi:hypothetical protein AMAG_20225 [Allomyces macrogynus ATCC 38327]|uniref:Sm domain-containing protein n=1 Tax=Allomyces macrogynus (strain ATCC 38327) TaxID=578462 RepID=A0A0L0T694_ALLM3|nr:hypothetical protein AMAG_20225 [Allomyces macrogynus ATCC 38327]|eukprot:KNE70059.1 hypothetical protein AMAG_20225 [Allomyces macrogynus ATCC 38327]
MAATSITPPPVPPRATGPAAVATPLHALLEQVLRVHVTDGRVFAGKLKCTDRDRNLVLSETVEITPQGDERHVAMVMVPGKHLTKVEALAVAALPLLVDQADLAPASNHGE